MQLPHKIDLTHKIHLPHHVRHIHWGRIAQSIIVVLSLIAIWLTLRVLNPAPPDTITIATGAPGSAYEQAAQKYQGELIKNGITVKILHTHGALQNLKLLGDPASGVDVALVQSGIEIQKPPKGLASLGSMFYQPLMIFYRSPKPLIRLSELNGKRVAVGPGGSGTRYIAKQLLTANGLGPDAVQLLDLEGDDASQALLNHQADAIFLAGDSAAPATIRKMLHEDEVRLFDFTRADAYLRRFTYLHKITIPAGGFDIGEDLPSTNLSILAPTVEMLVRPSLHPAVQELLVEAASKVHNRTTLLQNAGDFPKPLTDQFPLSESAERYYKDGDLSPVYRYIRPFWLASLVNRLWVTALSLAVIVLPALHYAPSLYSWRIDNKIHQRYGQLMALERELVAGGLTEERRAQLISHLDQIEHTVIFYKFPGSHAEQLYLLRQHIDFVRAHLTRSAGGGEQSQGEPHLALLASAH